MSPDTETVDEAAAKRCEFRLAYARSPRKRRIGVAYLDGADVPCAYTTGEVACGEWDHGLCPGDSEDENDWIDHFASMAINEAVHEALEWFRVDGRPAVVGPARAV